MPEVLPGDMAQEIKDEGEVLGITLKTELNDRWSSISPFKSAPSTFCALHCTRDRGVRNVTAREGKNLL